MNPTRITIHPQGGIIAHYPDRAVPISQLSVAERADLLGVMADRYNAHDDLAARAAAVPEEALV